MKLIIQIPCFNEENNLPIAINSIPRVFHGIDKVEILVIDDGSSDNTTETARKLGVNHIKRLKVNSGLAAAFSEGLKTSLELGADIVVNTDGDNQYNAQDIQKLINPIILKQADIVIGNRQVMQVKFFSPVKKKLQKLGSSVVSKLAGINIPDVTSGFRAYSREALLKMEIFSDFTYTLETIFHAGRNKIKVMHAPIQTNFPLRKSRLFSSIGKYIYKSGITLIQLMMLYASFKSFLLIGFLAAITGILLFCFSPADNIKLCILASLLAISGIGSIFISFVVNKLSVNRKLIEKTLTRVKGIESDYFHYINKRKHRKIKKMEQMIK